MDAIAPFGFVTGCHQGDKFHVQATLASIQHFCPNIPICLIVDGTFDVSDLVQHYGVIVLRTPDLPSEPMRALLQGNQRAKLAAVWEGPFEFFVWLDSDAILWGDLISQVRTDADFHIFWKEAEQRATPDAPDGFKHFYFDPDRLKQFDPSFQWEGNTYFCSGAFGCRKHAFSFEEWQQAESWEQQSPTLFRMGEQGLLNYLVHAKSQRGELRLAVDDLQHVWAHHGKQELVEDCHASRWSFPPHIPRPRIAHFCYRKPNIFDPQAYSKPFTIARLEHHRKTHSNMGAWQAVIAEDLGVYWQKGVRKILRTLPV